MLCRIALASGTMLSGSDSTHSQSHSHFCSHSQSQSHSHSHFYSHQPEITETRVQDDDEFFILACDGLWDVLSSQEAVSYVRERLRPHVAGVGKAQGTSTAALRSGCNLSKHNRGVIWSVVAKPTEWTVVTA